MESGKKLFEVAVWDDLRMDLVRLTRKKLSGDLLEKQQELLGYVKKRKWILLEFIPERGEEMVLWLSEMVYFMARNKEDTVKICVLANYDLVETPMRPYWRGEFGEKAGAIFQRFPDGIKTFPEAVNHFIYSRT